MAWILTAHLPFLKVIQGTHFDRLRQPDESRICHPKRVGPNRIVAANIRWRHWHAIYDGRRTDRRLRYENRYPIERLQQ